VNATLPLGPSARPYPLPLPTLWTMRTVHGSQQPGTLLYAHTPLYELWFVDNVDNQLAHCPHCPHGARGQNAWGQVWTLWTLFPCVLNRCTPFAYFLSTWVFVLFISTVHNIHKPSKPLIGAALREGQAPSFSQSTRNPQNPQNSVCYKLLQICLRVTVDNGRKSLTLDTSATNLESTVYDTRHISNTRSTRPRQ
jgi:hypothetical protein